MGSVFRLRLDSFNGNHLLGFLVSRANVIRDNISLIFAALNKKTKVFSYLLDGSSKRGNRRYLGIGVLRRNTVYLKVKCNNWCIG